MSQYLLMILPWVLIIFVCFVLVLDSRVNLFETLYLKLSGRETAYRLKQKRTRADNVIKEARKELSDGM